MEVRHCPRCDTQIDDGGHYCSQCGRAVVATGQTSPLSPEDGPRTEERAHRQLPVLLLLVISAIVSAVGLLGPFAGGTQPPIPMATPASSVVSSADLTMNMQEYPAYTVYWKRELWERAVQKNRQDVILLNQGTLVQFGDCNQGVTFRFPTDKWVQAFGFDYGPSELGALRFAQYEVVIPAGRQGFVGVVSEHAPTNSFVLLCGEQAQRELVIDNIVSTQTDSR
ncbi:MAG: zinc ribbon domain-containing protein [Roseiflexaceae bacterium]|nr:zinc ribbon domain-containing protein [Roseiflexaceae bacterium]